MMYSSSSSSSSFSSASLSVPADSATSEPSIGRLRTSSLTQLVDDVVARSRQNWISSALKVAGVSVLAVGCLASIGAGIFGFVSAATVAGTPIIAISTTSMLAALVIHVASLAIGLGLFHGGCR